ncbi:hypothetical protein CHUAL_000308 [Chamberlinius hualienensis]
MAIGRRLALAAFVIILVQVLNVFKSQPILNNNFQAASLKVSHRSRELLEWPHGRNCTPAAIEQFPRPIMSQTVRLRGGFLVHVFIALILFISLAFVCDDYFVPSLECICNYFHLQPDVAGATFMAAGSSAPELATAVIGVFVTKDDIGLGAVVGSAVFNIMFVIGICALWTTTSLNLDWWPLTRDCIFYLISIIALLITIFDEIITWYESVAFLILYMAYCIIMYFNPTIERFAKRLMSYRCMRGTEKDHLVAYNKVDASVYESDAEKVTAHIVDNDGDTESIASSTRINSEDEIDHPLKFPDGAWRRFTWLVTLPFGLLFYVTIPDCRKQKWRRWFVITFLMSIVWVSVLSYLMVWMITIIGFTFGIPDTVMGLTFLAAGVSVPDAFASLLVLKDGLADMAVSNAVGSNVFDILVCLGLPWFIQTVLIKPASTVLVSSKGLTYSTISLFSTVLFLLLAVHFNRWKLNRPLGVALMLWYLIFMVLASLYELNVFGEFNPPTCSSDY